MIIVFYKDKIYSLPIQGVSVIAPFVFAIILPFLLQNSSSLSLFFNLIFFPFTLVHELGHYLTAIFFFPGQKPVINIHFTPEGLQCASTVLGETNICWNLVLVVVSGSLFVMLTVLCSFLLLKKQKSGLATSLKYYLLFGLLSDLPNLFPIYPQQGIFPDGFRMWLYLHELIHLPYPTPQFSYLFLGISSILIFYSSYFLGKSIYQLFINFKIRIHLSKPTESVA